MPPAPNNYARLLQYLAPVRYAEDAGAMALDAASGHLAGTENACPSAKQVQATADAVEDGASDVDSDDDTPPAGTLGVNFSHVLTHSCQRLSWTLGCSMSYVHVARVPWPTFSGVFERL